MKLQEQLSELSSLCREFESKTESIIALKDFSIKVDQKENLSEYQIDQSILSTYAIYHRVEQVIIINRSEFKLLERGHKLAVLSHEVGHAFRHQINAEPLTSLIGTAVSDCIPADRLACSWGFAESLLDMRMEDYGSEYCDCLRKWEIEDEFRICMSRWYLQKIAGMK